MYTEYGYRIDDYLASLSVCESHKGEYYIIGFHKGEMPIFNSTDFETIGDAKSWAKTELGITHWRGPNGWFTARPD